MAAMCRCNLWDMRRARRSTEGSGASNSPGTSPVPRVSFDRNAAPGPPPSTSNRLAGLSDFDFQKALQASLRQRRTSLPVSSNALLINKPAVRSFNIFLRSFLCCNEVIVHTV
uniref:NumbF domain-containing protein n=1 Tax=Ascaris lumbricoides TaxID=6252 RepID=A0A0M3I688_ASCLU